MKGDRVPENHHISRYCSTTRCTEDGQVTGAAFELRQTEEYLSVNWMEFLNLVDRAEEIRAVRRILSSKITVGTNAKIAILNVGEIVTHVRANSPDFKILSVIHEPEEDDPSHSGVYGFEYNDPLIADLLAEVINDTYPALEPN